MSDRSTTKRRISRHSIDVSENGSDLEANHDEGEEEEGSPLSSDHMPHHDYTPLSHNARSSQKPSNTSPGVRANPAHAKKTCEKDEAIVASKGSPRDERRKAGSQEADRRKGKSDKVPAVREVSLHKAGRTVTRN